MRILTKISDYIALVSKLLSALFIGILSVVLVVQVILRTFFSSGLSWSVEFSAFAIIWAVMLIANVLIKDNELISVDFLDHLFSENFKKMRNVIYQIVFVFLLIVMTYYGWLQSFENANKITTALGISWFYPYFAIPVGSFLMLYQYLYMILLNVKKIKESD